MFEKPTIVDLGEAREVVLGIAFLGADLDGSFVIPDMEYYPDQHSSPTD